MNYKKPFFRLFPWMLLSACLAVAGCNKAPDAGAAATSGKATAPVSVAALTAEATGFSAGSQVSARTVYIFFDAQCPHCGALWNAAKPLGSQARFVWIPVGLLGPSSTAQGAALLAAKDPVVAMEEHETSLTAKQGGISATGNLDAQKALVAKNTELMNRFGFSSIPTIIGTHAQTGNLVTQEGAMPTAALANLLGLQAPAN